ncbi:MAG: hypothetical protein A3E00_01260 [Curvibacter sp. RIFCSPHIGHO2_12_FULL_63_18]|nr:MAG: hypothetical protein A2037_05260 [Curvibacter sp. GWA2_63_95]OGP03281.1 MAG: hypothetical protein A3E00_01260 [Curvibacter sp. RIFCSPHIGHO2_12_FULL_63_18]HCX83383.1 helix-turn-helix transcriptional regulator [Rhodoferax sp.]
MNGAAKGLFLSQDAGLLSHWRKALRGDKGGVHESLNTLALGAIGEPSLLWVDMSTPQLPAWNHSSWAPLLHHPYLRVVATSSNPKDAEAVAALDAGCAGYCHAYADAATLRQVEQVVRVGHVWIGPNLMQKLIQTANHAAARTPPTDTWALHLTAREKQVALLAAKAASNLDIANQCGISERTVKAHLSAVFEKLGIADRLQLALKVHGIQ